MISINHSNNYLKTGWVIASIGLVNLTFSPSEEAGARPTQELTAIRPIHVQFYSSMDRQAPAEGAQDSDLEQASPASPDGTTLRFDIQAECTSLAGTKQSFSSLVNKFLPYAQRPFEIDYDNQGLIVGASYIDSLKLLQFYVNPADPWQSITFVKSDYSYEAFRAAAKVNPSFISSLDSTFKLQPVLHLQNHRVQLKKYAPRPGIDSRLRYQEFISELGSWEDVFKLRNKAKWEYELISPETILFLTQEAAISSKKPYASILGCIGELEKTPPAVPERYCVEGLQARALLELAVYMLVHAQENGDFERAVSDREEPTVLTIGLENALGGVQLAYDLADNELSVRYLTLASETGKCLYGGDMWLPDRPSMEVYQATFRATPSITDEFKQLFLGQYADKNPYACVVKVLDTKALAVHIPVQAEER